MDTIALIESILKTAFKSLPPLVLAGLASMITVKIGLLNLGLEGMMLMSAFTAVVVNYYTGSSLVGLVAAVLVSSILGLIFAIFNIRYKVNNIIISVAINGIGFSLTKYLLKLLFGTSGAFTSPDIVKIPEVPLSFLKNIPVLREFSNCSIIFWISIILTVVLAYVINKMPLGLRIRATGLNDTAVNTAGVSSDRIKYLCCVLSGTFCGLAGAYMSTSYLTMFTPGMTSGRGYLGNIASILGGRTPTGTFLGASLFSFTESMTLRIQTFGFPSQLIQLIPYSIAMLCLIFIAVLRKHKEKEKNLKLVA